MNTDYLSGSSILRHSIEFSQNTQYVIQREIHVPQEGYVEVTLPGLNYINSVIATSDGIPFMLSLIPWSMTGTPLENHSLGFADIYVYNFSRDAVINPHPDIPRGKPVEVDTKVYFFGWYADATVMLTVVGRVTPSNEDETRYLEENEGIGVE